MRRSSFAALALLMLLSSALASVSSRLQGPSPNPEPVKIPGSVPYPEPDMFPPTPPGPPIDPNAPQPNVQPGPDLHPNGPAPVRPQPTPSPNPNPNPGSVPNPNPNPNPEPMTIPGSVPYPEPDMFPPTPKGPPIDPNVPQPDVQPGPDIPRPNPNPNPQPVEIPGSVPYPEPNMFPPHSPAPPNPAPYTDPNEAPWPDVEPGPDLTPGPATTPTPFPPIPDPVIPLPPKDNPAPNPTPEPGLECPGNYESFKCVDGVWTAKSLNVTRGGTWGPGRFHITGDSIITDAVRLKQAHFVVEGDLKLEDTVIVDSTSTFRVTEELVANPGRLHLVLDEDTVDPFVEVGCAEFLQGDFVIEVTTKGGSLKMGSKLPLMSLMTCSTIGLPDPVVYFLVNGVQYCGDLVRNNYFLSATIKNCETTPSTPTAETPSVPPGPDWATAPIPDVLQQINTTLWNYGLENITMKIGQPCTVMNLRAVPSKNQTQLLIDQNMTGSAKEMEEALYDLISDVSQIPLTRLGQLDFYAPLAKRGVVDWSTGWVVALTILDPSTIAPTPRPPRGGDSQTALYVILGIFGVCVVIIVAVVVVMLRRKSDAVQYEPVPTNDDEEGLVDANSDVY